MWKEHNCLVDGDVVLIVDDHAGFRRIARRMLEAAGFGVREAATGQAAVESVVSQPPDVVLLDIQLPDTDGFDVARRLRLAGSPALVVLTSSRSAADYGPMLRHCAAAGFVAKEELSGKLLRRLLAESR
jgi:two-component system response regulator EvgA